MAGTLKLRLYPGAPSSGCCVGQYYAVIFNSAEQALKLDSGAYVFQDYTKANHADFCIDLAEFSERDFCYYVDADMGVVSATPDGEYYYIEYWRDADAPSGSHARTDEFISSEKFIWDGIAVADSRESDALKLADNLYHAEFSVLYNPADNILTWQAFLQKSGREVAGVSSCQVTIYDGSSTFASASSAGPVLISSGVFQGSINGIVFTAGKIYYVKADITDNSGRTFSSGKSLIIWQ